MVNKSNKTLTIKKHSKTYVVSSTKFASLREAEIQLADWQEAGTLDENTKVYEVKETFVYIVKLVKEK